MPKRPIVEPEFPEALAAIREALKHPRILTAEEERDFLERRKGMYIERHEYVATLRRGKIVYREHGKAGADLSVPPYYWEMLKQRRDREVQISKAERACRMANINRQLRSPQGARKRHAEILETISGLDHLPVRNRASTAARKLGIPVRTVRSAIAQEKRQAPKVLDSDT
jgi:hypothetical protein